MAEDATLSASVLGDDKLLRTEPSSALLHVSTEPAARRPRDVRSC
jgi:hypothetical protein